MSVKKVPFSKELCVKVRTSDQRGNVNIKGARNRNEEYG